MVFGLLVFVYLLLQSQSQTYWFLGVMDMSTRFENHENEDICDLGNVKIKSYKSNMKQNNYTRLFGLSKV